MQVAEKCRRGVAEGMGRGHPRFPAPGAPATTTADALEKVKEAALRRPSTSGGRKGLERMHSGLTKLTRDVNALKDAVEAEERQFFAVTARSDPRD